MATETPKEQAMSKMISVAVIVVAVVCVAIFYAGRLAYRSIAQNRFDSQVCEYSHQTQRDSAWAIFNLAKSELRYEECMAYEKRLDSLETHHQHRFASALSTLFDPEFGKKKIDSFDSVTQDISYRLGREESPGKEIWTIWKAQMDVNCVAWPFICQGFHNSDGSESRVSYEKYLELKERLGPAKEKMEVLLATYRYEPKQ